MGNLDKNKHTKNGLIQKKILVSDSHYIITLSFFPGIAGETACIHVYDGSLRLDDNSPKEFCIPNMNAREFHEIAENIKAVLKERETTLIKKKKKRKIRKS